MRVHTLKLWLLLLVLNTAISKEPLPSARELSPSWAKYVYESNLKSDLFSTCIEEAHSVEGSLYSIEVATGKWYTRMITISNRKVSWKTIAGAFNFIHCATKAHDANAYMFKYPNKSCIVATNDAYARHEVSCEGEEVFTNGYGCPIIDGTILPGKKFVLAGCSFSCGEDGVMVDADGNRVDFSKALPMPEVCRVTADGLAYYTKNDDEKPYCAWAQTCYLYGMTLPPISSDKEIADLLHVTQIKEGRVWGYVVYDETTGRFVHGRTNETVDIMPDPGACITVAYDRFVGIFADDCGDDINGACVTEGAGNLCS